MSLSTLGSELAASDGSIKTGPFGTTLKASEYSRFGVPVISVGEIGEWSFRISDRTPRVDSRVLDRLPEYVLEEGDVVFARKGSVDRAVLVGAAQAGWFLGSDGLRVRPGNSIHSKFLSYYVMLPEKRRWLRNHAAGTTMLSLSGAVLSALPVAMPNLVQQQAIAEVLGALDDKIAANAAVARLLERLLRAEFAYAHLDVEPLMSDRIPLCDVIDLNPKYAIAGAADPRYVEMQKLPIGSMNVQSWDWRPAAGGARFQNGDTLLARITPCLENGKTGFVDFLESGETGLGSTEYIVMRAKGGLPLSYSYFLATDPRFRSFAIQHMVGTSGRQRVNASELRNFPVLDPRPRIDRFANLSAAAVPRLSALRDENQTLAALRDTLLPALMSGRLRVRDAEVKVGEVL